MNLGIIFTSYATEDLTEISLRPWLDTENVKVAAVSFPFRGFEPCDNTKNLEILNKLKYNYSDKFVALHYGDTQLNEADARNLALQSLLPQSDVLIIVDSDEIEYNIDGLKQYIIENPLNPVFKIEFKNLIFDNFHYYEGFNPARIFRRNFGIWELKRCHYDNNFTYKCVVNNESIVDQHFAHKIIPKRYCNPLHYSWLSNERSRRKIEYQIKHFGQGNPNACSFKWNYEKGELEINDDYYRLTGKEKPIIKEL